MDELQKEPAALPSARAQAARQAAEAAGGAGDGTAAVTPLIAFLLDQHAGKGGRGRGVQARTPLLVTTRFQAIGSQGLCAVSALALHSKRSARLPVQRARTIVGSCLAVAAALPDTPAAPQVRKRGEPAHGAAQSPACPPRRAEPAAPRPSEGRATTFREEAVSAARAAAAAALARPAAPRASAAGGDGQRPAGGDGGPVRLRTRETDAAAMASDVAEVLRGLCVFRGQH